MTKRRWAWLLGIAALLALTVAVGLLFLWTPPSRIVRGVWIGPIEVSNMTTAEARASLEARLADQPAELELVSQTGNHKANRSELLMGFDLDRSLAEAQSIGRGHGLWMDLSTQWRLRNSSTVVPLYPILSEQGLSSLHPRLMERFATPSRPATFSVHGDKVSINPSQDGQEVPFDELRREIEQAMAELEATATLPLQVVRAVPSSEDLATMGIEEKVAEYSSTFNLDLAGRAYNIRKAAQSLDGQIIAPGEIFSFNQVVGPADASDGYQEAIIISNGEFTTGVGGGVCQVSSTLYGAVLRANLKITERHNHSLIVTYVPPALDATVSYPVQDFCFQNTEPNHIMIKTETVGNRVTVRIYGRRDPTIQVQVESRVLETYPALIRTIPDDTLPAGEEVVVQNGSVGYLAVAHRRVYRSGQLILNEQLSQDYYSPSTRVVRVGTQPNSAAAPDPGAATSPTPETTLTPSEGLTQPNSARIVNPAQEEMIPN